MTALLFVVIILFIFTPSAAAASNQQELETPSDMVQVASTWYDFLRYKLYPIIFGLILAVSGFKLLAPIFFGSSAKETGKPVSATIRIVINALLGYFVVLFLPTILKGVVSLIKQYAWSP